MRDGQPTIQCNACAIVTRSTLFGSILDRAADASPSETMEVVAVIGGRMRPSDSTSPTNERHTGEFLPGFAELCAAQVIANDTFIMWCNMPQQLPAPTADIDRQTPPPASMLQDVLDERRRVRRPVLRVDGRRCRPRVYARRHRPPDAQHSSSARRHATTTTTPKWPLANLRQRATPVSPPIRVSSSSLSKAHVHRTVAGTIAHSLKGTLKVHRHETFSHPFVHWP